jgi:hypothetical protein
MLLMHDEFAICWYLLSIQDNKYMGEYFIIFQRL